MSKQYAIFSMGLEIQLACGSICEELIAKSYEKARKRMGITWHSEKGCYIFSSVLLNTYVRNATENEC